MTVIFLVDGEPVDFETYCADAIRRGQTKKLEDALATIDLREKRDARASA